MKRSKHLGVSKLLWNPTFSLGIRLDVAVAGLEVVGVVVLNQEVVGVAALKGAVEDLKVDVIAIEMEVVLKAGVIVMKVGVIVMKVDVIVMKVDVIGMKAGEIVKGVDMKVGVAVEDADRVVVVGDSTDGIEPLMLKMKEISPLLGVVLPL